MKKQPWHDSFLESLRELADANAQRDEWLEHRNAEFPMPAELLCQVFDDSGIDDLLETGEIFTGEADALIREMSDLVGRIDVNQPAVQLLEDWKWRRLVALAGEAVTRVEAILEDE